MLFALPKSRRMRLIFAGLCVMPFSVAKAAFPSNLDIFKNNHVLDNFKQGNLLAYLKQGHVLVEIGDYFGKQSENQHLNSPTLIGYQYTPHSSIGSNILLGLGYEHALKTSDKLNFSYGLSLSYLAPADVTGNIFIENQLNNLTYSYQVANLPIYGLVKASQGFKNPKYKWIADVGIGPNVMWMKDYQETPLLENTVPNNALSDATKMTFSFTLGFGIEMSDEIKTHAVRCGYRFYYLGEGAFNHNDKVTNTLSTGPVYANAGVCSMMF